MTPCQLSAVPAAPRPVRRRLRSLAAALLLGAGLGPMLVSCETVPISGRSQLILMSPGDEARLGLQAYQDILKKERVSTDPEKTALVARVGARIAAATGRTDFQWEFRLIENDRMVNAFCLPGGKVAVYTGILPITRDEAGLAAGQVGQGLQGQRVTTGHHQALGALGKADDLVLPGLQQGLIGSLGQGSRASIL